MQLVIVESPTKAKTLAKYLGSDYKIMASMGHLRDLPKDRLGIDVNHDFIPHYQVPSDHKKIASELKEEVKKASLVILATDPDREGEAIAWHIAEILKIDGRKWKVEKTVSRITFHEITENAIKEALKNPGTINLPLVDAQQARRVLDRLVGYKLSPLLWSKVRRGLSAGRVQSVALRIIVEREREIEKFKKEEYWSIVLKITSPLPSSKGEGTNEVVDFELISKDGIKYETSESFKLYDGQYTVGKTTILTKDQADVIISDIKNHIVYISDIEKKATKRYPLPPFTTSTLQQEAGRKLGFSAKKTMQIAQRLYENGFISYHRTDSVNLAMEAISKARDFIAADFGKEYVPNEPRIYSTKQKLAQEAHEAIRPTKLEIGNWKLEIGTMMGRDEGRLYELIWKRFVACQMKEAEIERTTVWAKTAKNVSDLSNLGDLGYLFKTSGSIITFPGFLKVYPEALEETRLPASPAGGPVLEKEQKLPTEEIISLQHFTEPAPRYSEASLIATLEERGIGRPSTYAPTLSVIQERHYVEKEDLPDGKRGKRLKPTALGIAVNDFLVSNFSQIDDMPFTAQMEDQLDEIASGQKQWVPVIRDFFTPFSENLQKIYKTAERVKIEVEQTDEKCPTCGAPLVVRIGRFGKFLACSKFPECKFTKNLTISTGLKCPEDQGDVIIRRTKRGKTFYGCSNYPNCRWASWTKPK
ncbi:type I DNA topoisomerase [Candidatus Gottesmanbacteria bacterium]|nr:type I DNA topoisomerase [Candidatus Gottesmanbacteria bacterium]